MTRKQMLEEIGQETKVEKKSTKKSTSAKEPKSMTTKAKSTKAKSKKTAEAKSTTTKAVETKTAEARKARAKKTAELAASLLLKQGTFKEGYHRVWKGKDPMGGQYDWYGPFKDVGDAVKIAGGPDWKFVQERLIYTASDGNYRDMTMEEIEKYFSIENYNPFSEGPHTAWYFFDIKEGKKRGPLSMENDALAAVDYDFSMILETSIYVNPDGSYRKMTDPKEIAESFAIYKM